MTRPAGEIGVAHAMLAIFEANDVKSEINAAGSHRMGGYPDLETLILSRGLSGGGAIAGP